MIGGSKATAVATTMAATQAFSPAPSQMHPMNKATTSTSKAVAATPPNQTHLMSLATISTSKAVHWNLMPPQTSS